MLVLVLQRISPRDLILKPRFNYARLSVLKRLGIESKAEPESFKNNVSLEKGVKFLRKARSMKKRFEAQHSKIQLGDNFKGLKLMHEPQNKLLHSLPGQMGCKIIPATPIIEASEVELCAEWGSHRACTKVLLLPQIRLSSSKVSLLSPPTTFTVSGHPQALKLVRLTPSPGLKLDTSVLNGKLVFGTWT